MRRLLEETPGLTLLEGTVEEIETRTDGERPAVTGLRLGDGRAFKTQAVIVTAGNISFPLAVLTGVIIVVSVAADESLPS